MTDRMMTESMPVNRNALAQMFRSVSAHPMASPESIVQMTKLDMPLTESNVIQFENYRNFEHRITGDLQSVSDGIADLFREAVSGLSSESQNTTSAFVNMSAHEVVNEVLNLIDTDSLDTIMPDLPAADSVTAGQAAQGQGAQIPEGENALTDGLQTATGEAQTVIAEAQTATAETQTVTADAQTAMSGPEDATVSAGAQTENVQSVIKNTVDGLISEIKGMFVPDGETTVQAQNAGTEIYNPALSLTGAEQITLSSDLQNLLILAGEASDIHEPLDPSQVIGAVKKLLEEYPPDVTKVAETELSAYSEETAGTADESKLVDAAQKDIASLSPEMIKEKISSKLSYILKSDGFTKLVKDSVKAQMSIKPQDIAQNGKIEELYENIRRTSERVSRLMENIGRSDSPVAQSSSALTENVNFMNQLNEFVNYVQLPLKMAGEDANGELYVYTNRKNLANKDGNYSALLHLDMEHLGPMDVYVTMRDHTKVSTNFYLENEKVLDFIAAHIDELTKRLTEKGYVTNTKVTQKEPGKPVSPITDEFTKDEVRAGSPVIVSRMRFDVRA